MSYQSKIQAAKRNEFRQRQQVNRLYAQRIQEGMTPAEAATTPYTFSAPQQVTIQDGQTLDKIASANGIGVTDLLNANPDMTAPKTGMVINVPRSMALANAGGSLFGHPKKGGVGLPSNAALGGLSTNPSGRNGRDFHPHTPEEYAVGAILNPAFHTGQTNTMFGAAGQNVLNTILNPAFRPGQTNAMLGLSSAVAGHLAPYAQNALAGAGGAAGAQYGQPLMGAYDPRVAFGLSAIPGATQQLLGSIGQQLTPQQAALSAPAIKNLGTAFAPTFRTKDDYLPTELAARVQLLGINPTKEQLNYLERYGMITKVAQPAYGGGGYRPYGKGGRGRGGGGRAARIIQQQEPRPPAFSSGAGISALVNWRI